MMTIIIPTANNMKLTLSNGKFLLSILLIDFAMRQDIAYPVHDYMIVSLLN